MVLRKKPHSSVLKSRRCEAPQVDDLSACYRYIVGVRSPWKTTEQAFLMHILKITDSPIYISTFGSLSDDPVNIERCLDSRSRPLIIPWLLRRV